MNPLQFETFPIKIRRKSPKVRFASSFLSCSSAFSLALQLPLSLLLATRCFSCSSISFRMTSLECFHWQAIYLQVYPRVYPNLLAYLRPKQRDDLSPVRLRWQISGSVIRSGMPDNEILAPALRIALYQLIRQYQFRCSNRRFVSV